MFQFLFPAQHRVQFILGRQFIQVPPESVQQFQSFLQLRFRFFFFGLGFKFVFFRQGMCLDKFFVHHDLHPVHINRKTRQDPGSDAAIFCQQSQQDMPGTDQVQTVRIRKGFRIMQGRRRFFCIGSRVSAFHGFSHPGFQFP